MKKLNNQELYKAQYKEQNEVSKVCGVEIINGELILICFSAKHKLSNGKIVNMIYSRHEHEIFLKEKPTI